MEPIERGADFLEHYGVKGMKWGVRKDKGHEGEQVSTRKLKKLDKKWDKENTGTAGYVKAHNAAASRFNKEAIDQINNKPVYKKAADSGTLTDFDHPTTKKYHKEIEDRFADMMVESFADLGMNPSGTKQYVIKKDGNGLDDAFLEPVSKNAKHADDENERYKLTFHSNGLLKSMATDSLKHTVDLGEDFLEHYGVKGMKWGVRRSDRELKRSKSSKPEPSEDKKTTNAVKSKISKGNTDALSNDELRKINERMQLEQKYSELTSKTQTSSKGKAFVRQLANQDKQKIMNGNFKDLNSQKAMKLGGAVVSGTAFVAGAASLGNTLKRM